MRAVTVALINSHPTIRISLITEAPEHFFNESIRSPRISIIRRRCAGDFGMKMASSVDVLRDESLRAYRQVHRHWDRHVADEIAFLRSLRPDMVLTCASYLPLYAAHLLSIAAYMVGPFSWYDILAHYCPDVVEHSEIGAPMHDAYAAASGVLACQPAVPPQMAYPEWLPVGPIGLPAVSCRSELRQKLGLSRGEKVAVVSLGGIAEPNLDLSRWPSYAGWRLICAGDGVSDIPGLNALGLSVGQAIASCDAVITKPGYGTYVEAACAGTAILYRERSGWPETVGLTDWAAQYVAVKEVRDEDFCSGNLGEALSGIAEVISRPLGFPLGNEHVARFILEKLGVILPNM